MTQVRLNPALDPASLARRFTEAGQRIQIEDFLESDDAKGLSAAASALDWNLVLNSGARHVDLNASQQKQAGKVRMTAILAEVQKNAPHKFQYLYENYPVTDLAEANQLTDPWLAAAYATMNSNPVRDLLQQITGKASDFCDMQATRYRPGDFLTVHDDNAGEKNRKLAYVLSLTDGWMATWGGQLQFLDSGGRVASAFMPRFNALSVFAVPTPHHVSQVSSFAPKGRVSLTGWFRTKSLPGLVASQLGR
jgi:Rps23 Pro-64 3,4-dihydroxylase Tpa1-like proline 4-hydroxylase